MPRGNGKTTLAAPIGLYLTFVEGEGGAEGYAAAVTRDQARILFDAAQNMVRRSPGFRAAFGVGVGANAIHQERTASRFAPVSSDAKALDGLNVQVAVCDEIASHKTSEVYDVLLTAMGKRRHPLLLSISTATGNNTGIGKQLWDYAGRVLDGTQEDERLFALVHAADPEDDPWEEATWIKANPSWGQAVQPDAIRAIMRQARNNPAQEAAAKTRHLNVWVGADEALFSTRAWRGLRGSLARAGGLRGAALPHRPGPGAQDRPRRAWRSSSPAAMPEGQGHLRRLRPLLPERGGGAGGAQPELSGLGGRRAPGDHARRRDRLRPDRGRHPRAVRALRGGERRHRPLAGGAPFAAAARRGRATWWSSAPRRRTSARPSSSSTRPCAPAGSGTTAIRCWSGASATWSGQEDRRGNLFPAKQRESRIDAAVALMMAVGRAQASRTTATEDITAFLATR